MSSAVRKRLRDLRKQIELGSGEAAKAELSAFMQGLSDEEMKRAMTNLKRLAAARDADPDSEEDQTPQETLRQIKLALDDSWVEAVIEKVQQAKS